MSAVHSPHHAEFFPKPKPDTAAMRSALDAMFFPDDVIELRAFPKGKKGVAAGYFDGEHRGDLANHAGRLNSAGAAVYVSLNQIDPQLLGRYSNRIEDYARETVSDKDVIRRRWLLIDLDPVRPANTSATAAQVAAAKERADACRQALKAEGWPLPMVCESGNGMHLVYPLDLPNDAESTALVKGALAGLAARFDIEVVKVDPIVYNAGRIIKLYGTVANKGDHVPDTPWRLSRLVSGTDRDVTVTADQLRALHPKGGGADLKARSARNPGEFGHLDLPAFLLRLSIAYEHDVHDGAERYKLEHCPFNPDHGRGEAAIFQLPDGRLGFKCQHSSCADKHWQDVRALVDGPREGRASSRSEDLGRGPTSGAKAPAGDEPSPGDGAAAEGGCDGEKVTVAEVLRIFRKWLHLPDAGSVYVPLGAVAANHLDSDPVWLTTVGPPSGGKTEVILAIARLPYVRLGAILTEAPLLSGTPKKETKAAGGKGGLLKEIGAFGILVLKDFTSILAMHRDQRSQLLAALREIFDGSWTRNVGTDGGRTLTWSGKLGLIAGCTAAIDTHHAVMSTMGERFILYRLPTIDPAKQAERALANAGQEGVMRKELAAAVAGLFARLDIRGKRLPPIDEDETTRLVALSSLVASARSAVDRSPYGGREIELVLDTEAPARLAQTLRRLYAGLLIIGLDRATAWPLVAKTGLDCIPKTRRAVFDVLVTADWVTTKAIATRIAHPTTTTRRSLEDLGAHGVVDRRPGEKGKGDGKSDLWRLADVARARYLAIAPEKSAGENDTCTSTSLYNQYHYDDDISGATKKTTPECGFEGVLDDAETPVVRRCWSCKDEVADADRCPECGWIPCTCGACSPKCDGPHGGEGGRRVEVEV